MFQHGLPALFVLLLWWFSTGLILFIDGFPRRTFRWSLLGASVVGTLALYGMVVSSADATVAGAYTAFTCSLLVWGWHEVSFLLGYVTGPRKEPCPEGCSGWRHFGHAAATVMHHELAIAATAVGLVALTWGEPNQVGTWTFMVLWWMRLSAKLNVYLGVPNLTEEFLPEHLDYLKSFFNRKPMNLLFPVSVTAATIVAALMMTAAAAPDAAEFEAVGLTLLATLLTLAILEHWFLVLPVPDAALWSWGLRSRKSEKTHAAESGSPHRLPMAAAPQPVVVQPAPAAIGSKRAG
jgi:putative photosynthetic complex assembly protein 2